MLHVFRGYYNRQVRERQRSIIFHLIVNETIYIYIYIYMASFTQGFKKSVNLRNIYWSSLR